MSCNLQAQKISFNILRKLVELWGKDTHSEVFMNNMYSVIWLWILFDKLFLVFPCQVGAMD